MRIYQTSVNRPLEAMKVGRDHWAEVLVPFVPRGILCLIAGPSFSLLYFMEQVPYWPFRTVKVVGRQWY